MSTFKDLKDGSRFTVVTGDTTRVPVVYIKTEEDGGSHNATREDNSNQTIRLPETVEVEDLGMPENVIPFKPATKVNLEARTLANNLAHNLTIELMHSEDVALINRVIAFLNKL